MLVFIDHYIKKRGYSPTVRELALHFGLSTSTAFYHLNVLKDQGLVRNDPKAMRTWTTVDKQ